MKKGLVSFLLLMCLLAGAPGYAVASWTLYDNFNSGVIDPDKWYGYDSGNTGRETQRIIVSGKLKLSEQSYNGTGSDVGSSYSEQVLRFRESSNITGIKASIKPVQFKTIGCSSSSYDTWVYARLFGRFFNTDPQGSDNSTNEVYAYIAIERTSLSADSEDTARIKARVRHCSDKDCNTYQTLFQKDLMSIKEGQTATLSLEWDQVNHKFLFNCGGKKATFAYDPEKYPDTLPPNYDNKMLSVLSGAPNCTSSPRPAAYMNALFDNVYIKVTSP